MKKISTILALVMVMALAVPVLAAEDNVKITGEVNTMFEEFNSTDGDAAFIFEDGDAYDDDAWSENAFYQEIDFSIESMVNEDTSLTLDLNTLENYFTTDKSADGPFLDSSNLSLDTALLTLDNPSYTVKLGDLEDYAVAEYFMDEKTVQGIETTVDVVGNEIKVFAVGSETDYTFDEGTSNEYTLTGESVTNYYGATVTRDLELAKLTGKVYQVKDYGLNTSADVTTFALAADADLTDMIAVNGEFASSSAESNTDTDLTNEGDSYVKLGTEVTPMDALTVTADMKQVGEEFVGVEDDLSGLDYTMYEVAGDYDLTDMLSVGTTVTLDDYANDDNDTTTVEVRGTNEMGALTTEVTFTNESVDANDDPTNTLAVNNTYELTEATTLTGNYTYKSFAAKNTSYNYLLAGADHELAENVTLNAEAFMGSGTNADVDQAGNGFKTTLTASF